MAAVIRVGAGFPELKYLADLSLRNPHFPFVVIESVSGAAELMGAYVKDAPVPLLFLREFETFPGDRMHVFLQAWEPWRCGEILRDHVLSASGVNDRTVIEVMELLFLSSCFHLSLNALAGMVGVSRRTLERRFRRAGLAVPQAYVHAAQTLAAWHLKRHTRLAHAAIARKICVGYDSVRQDVAELLGNPCSSPEREATAVAAAVANRLRLAARLTG